MVFAKNQRKRGIPYGRDYITITERIRKRVIGSRYKLHRRD
jgi:hypothetical protein